MRSGLTLPNSQWSAYTAAELAALGDLRPQTLVWLLYGGDVDQEHQRQLAPFIQKHAPRLLYRPYAQNIIQMHPITWAKQCRDWYGAVDLPGEVIPGNEFNLAAEGGSEDWPAQIDWLVSFQSIWRVIMPGVPLILPALSPSGNYRDGYRAYAAAGLGKLFDRVSLHIYGPS